MSKFKSISILRMMEHISSLTIWQLSAIVISFHILIAIIRSLQCLLHHLRPLRDILSKYTREQTWAVVTGGTDGIGLGFCQQLTALGFNLLIISRNENKLIDTIAKLRSLRKDEHRNRKIEHIVFDFSQSSDPQAFQALLSRLKTIDIGLLVNNVGTAYFCNSHQVSISKALEIINVNCVAISALTMGLLPQFLKRVKKTAIINLSSAAADFPIPFNSLYSASKAYDHSFSIALALEYPQLDILSVKPYFVESPLSRKKKGWNIPDRRQCALGCLKQLGQRESYGYYSHGITAAWANLVPRYLVRLLARRVASQECTEYYKQQ